MFVAADECDCDTCATAARLGGTRRDSLLVAKAKIDQRVDRLRVCRPLRLPV